MPDIHPIIDRSGLPLLRLMQLSSPNLPIGAFAYSQGLEQAVALGWIRDESTARDWILGLLSSSLATLDLPALARLHAAFSVGDDLSARRWNDYLYASRGTAELRMEDEHLGAGLARVLVGLGVEHAAAWARGNRTTHAAMFALAAATWNIAAESTLSGFAFAWTESQIGSATRIVPLGQQSAQRILSTALPVIDDAVAKAVILSDDDLGATAPGQAIASALHETLYSRLCRS